MILLVNFAEGGKRRSYHRFASTENFALRNDLFVTGTAMPLSH